MNRVLAFIAALLLISAPAHAQIFGPWHRSGTVLHPAISTDDYALGGSTLATSKVYFDVSGPSYYVLESAAAAADQAGYGQLWVRNDTPNVLVFTDDAGTDTVLGAGGGGFLTEIAGSPPVLHPTDTTSYFAIGGTSGTAPYFFDTPNGRFSIGGPSPAEQIFHVYQSTTSQTNFVLFEQDGAGDARLNFRLTANEDWSIGIDNSENDAFVISNSNSLNTNPYFYLESGTGFLGLGNQGPGAMVEITTSNGADIPFIIDTPAAPTADMIIARASGTNQWRVSATGSVFIDEKAAADADVANYGQLWVKTATPNQLWFTADDGSEVQLGVGGSSLWTDGGTVTYLTSLTDDLAIGGTDSTAPFFFDESAGSLRIDGHVGISADPNATAPLRIDDTTQSFAYFTTNSGNNAGFIFSQGNGAGNADNAYWAVGLDGDESGGGFMPGGNTDDFAIHNYYGGGFKTPFRIIRGADEIRFGHTEMARFDSDSTAGNTRFMVYDVDNATLERVTVGAADSGGSGFKVLRIPN